MIRRTVVLFVAAAAALLGPAAAAQASTGGHHPSRGHHSYHHKHRTHHVVKHVNHHTCTMTQSQANNSRGNDYRGLISALNGNQINLNVSDVALGLLGNASNNHACR